MAYPTEWTLVPLLLMIAWTVNLYNFMDGTDGLAGGMAVCGFGIFAVAAWQAGDLPLAQVAVVASAASAAFLIFNFPPANSVLGDVGSVPLGFLAAAIGLEGWINGVWPGWFPLMVFSPFIIDATIPLFKRVFRGARFWKAHRDHYYQRLVESASRSLLPATGAYGMEPSPSGARGVRVDDLRGSIGASES